MVAYSFKQRFVTPIRAGVKRQTVRPTGKRRHARPGEVLQLYTGMRTKHCQKIGVATCETVEPITIRFRSDRASDLFVLCGQEVSDTTLLDTFAVMDGFVNWLDLRAFWAKEHPRVDEFEGRLIRWKEFVFA